LIDAHRKRIGHLCRDLVLERQEIPGVVSLGPQVAAAFGFQQLDADAHGLARPADAPLQEITGPKAPRDPGVVEAGPTGRKNRSRRNNPEGRKPRNLGDEVLDETIGQPHVLRGA